ncbi:hypothetical protein JB92DRAFT_3028837 [Gautieria morchelliformis]|nr:hypothetical protein JB92DRAFT_3028837 [Gautieria morchelliformis]
MAPRRRSTRKASVTPRESSPQASDSSALSEAPPEPHAEDKDTCPSCPDQPQQVRAGEKDTWIQCDKCKTWFHWRCVGEGADHEALQKWYCQPCRASNPSLKPTLKPPARKSARKRTQPDYANLHAGLDASSTDGTKWLRIIETKDIKPDAFRRLTGNEVNSDWLEQDPEALKEPIVIESPEGLGMRMPDKDLTVADIADIVGPQTPVEVIDVSTQSNSPNWNLARWSEYYSLPPASRDKIRNVISLEFSNTPLAEKVSPPRIVKELDWVEKFWPPSKKGPGQHWPKVQMYCLMGVAQAWTDWHIDFAGSSVYYHIFRGSKVFYFIRPTPANLAAYERWSGTDLQSSTWLGDLVDEVVKVELIEGNTMVIPTGWIHAVFTPMDSLVFGGNFLHSWNMATQLRVRDIEIATHVPKKFRFPLFTRLCWYAGERYLRDIKMREDFPSRVLESLVALADFLVNEARIMEGRTGSQNVHSDAARKESRDAVPADKVKDAPALARELRWRVRNARGVSSSDEGPSNKRGKSLSAPKENGVKRKRDSADVGEPGETHDGRQMFRNWRRKGWELEEFLPRKCEKRVERRRRPAPKASTGMAELGSWVRDSVDADDEMDQTEDKAEHPDDEAVVESTTDVVVKVRRIWLDDAKEEALERQRVERNVKVYRWSAKDNNIAEVEITEPKHVVDEDKSITSQKQVEGDGITNGTGGRERKGTGEKENEPENDRLTVSEGKEAGETKAENIDEEAKTEDTPIVVDVQA